MRLGLVALALVLLLGGCASPTPPGTGLRGTVLLGPSCPVQRDPPDPQCADKPYAADLALTTQDGSRVVRTFTADGNGTFRVDVAPGTYAIRSAQGDPPSHPACSTAQPIVVVEGRYTDVEVSCDTGIR